MNTDAVLRTYRSLVSNMSLKVSPRRQAEKLPGLSLITGAICLLCRAEKARAELTAGDSISF